MPFVHRERNKMCGVLQMDTSKKIFVARVEVGLNVLNFFPLYEVGDH